MEKNGSKSGLGFSTGIFSQLSTSLASRGGWKRLAKNAYFDFRYGGAFLGGALASPGQNKGHFHTMNTDYGVFDRMFGKVALKPDDVIVDIGCGKGRIFNFLLSKGIGNRGIGVEINPAVAEFARRRLKGYDQFEVLCADVLSLEKIPGTVFFLFHPFSREIMEKFMDALLRDNAQGKGPRHRVIIYRNCVDLDLFEKSAAWKIIHRFTENEVDARHGGAIIELA